MASAWSTPSQDSTRHLLYLKSPGIAILDLGTGIYCIDNTTVEKRQPILSDSAVQSLCAWSMASLQDGRLSTCGWLSRRSARMSFVVLGTTAPLAVTAISHDDTNIYKAFIYSVPWFPTPEFKERGYSAVDVIPCIPEGYFALGTFQRNRERLRSAAETEQIRN
ncbi:hypothetical protein BKA56DRAFT_613479 [Ilyonectria sp. MPI-CAGE-AT-0026]|nr:hypothetical protein BKA56DRAFT_613479 [Ilyonectria sp. MPI-CAGE-AT-0026]